MNLTGQRNQCRGCNHYFNSNLAFTKHRTGEYEHNGRRCRTPEEMTAKGMSLNADGFWITEKMASNVLDNFKGEENEQR